MLDMIIMIVRDSVSDCCVFGEVFSLYVVSSAGCCDVGSGVCNFVLRVVRTVVVWEFYVYGCLCSARGVL